jgi:hypothetical protein
MEWPVIVALVVLVPVILIPVALLWYLNASALGQILRGTRDRQKRRAEVLREARDILEGGLDARDNRTTTFWADKTPCWEICNCPTQIREECPAYTNRLLPCWEIEGTYGKLAIEGGLANGRNTTTCQTCRVYRKYGCGQPICHRLVGAGIDNYLNSIVEQPSIEVGKETTQVT